MDGNDAIRPAATGDTTSVNDLSGGNDMSNYKREREINHKGEEGARRRNKACKSDPSCTFVLSD
jgi:hypothetical protein